MTKVLVLYYSMYGHIETMAQEVAKGARSVEDTDVTIKRVPELIPEDVARKAGAKLDQETPIATPNALAGSDGSRQPTENELAIARFQGAHVARVAKRQFA